MKRKLICLLCAALLLLPLNGCGTVRSGIVYTIYPIGFLIERLAGTNFNAQSIQKDFCLVQRAQLKDNYRDMLGGAELFLHIGDLEPYLSVCTQDIKNSGVTDMDLSSLNAIYDFGRYTQIITEEGVRYEKSEYYKGDAFASIDTDNLDLCLWNDPIAMLSMAKNICEWLSRNYPDQKDMYQENLKDLEKDLIDMDAQYQSLATNLINNYQEIKFVSMTASFGNWQKTYGFQVYPVVLSKYGVLPNSEQLNLIKQRIIADNVQYIVYEPNMTDDMKVLFAQLEEELGLVRVEMHNLSSLTETEEAMGKDYISLMYENLSVLETMRKDIVSLQN